MQLHMRTRLSVSERNGRDSEIGMVGFSLVIMFLVPCVSQHGPCYTCEEYRLNHPSSHPYQQIRGKCHYPCNCPIQKPICPEGVTVVTDGCNCCPMCAKQRREECDKIRVCDEKYNLECVYESASSPSGICADKVEGCEVRSSQWSECSATCGYGVSARTTNDNSRCELRNESRICRLRKCEEFKVPPSSGAVTHRHRLQHTCRATIKSRTPEKITDHDNCTTTKAYLPNYCNNCRQTCCKPEAVTTKIIPFRCPAGGVVERNVMWILRCSCETGSC